MHDFELLAPAGSFEILKAVEAAGADAVYVGGNVFGARAYANNFSQEELLEAIDYLHLRNKRLFLTVNTLMKNQEIMNHLYDFLLPLYNQGLDGVIVQDLGAVMFIHASFPDMEIHTSTQMTITGVDGVRFLMKYGVTRVVMAREMSLKEMQKIHEQTGVELEAFVHGALCYCYSGQCLFSSMLGGRSGNRGRCAQPCRLMYSVLDHDKSMIKKDSYILSLKDMCGIEDLPMLAEAGVYSLKIEGRMKQADYAAGVVSMYRKYIDLLNQNAVSEFKVSPKDKQHIMDLGNRCGFTNEYYYKHNESDMVTYVKPNYEKKETDVLETIHYSKISVNGHLCLRLDHAAEFTIYNNSISVTVLGQNSMLATNRPILCEDVKGRMRKTGDTPFEFDDLQIEMDDNLFVPNGQLNQLRRDALELFLNESMKGYRRNNSIEIQKTSLCNKKVNTGYSVLVSTRDQLNLVLENPHFELIYLDVYLYEHINLLTDLKKDVQLVRDKGKKVGVALPSIFRDKISAFYSSIVDELEALSIDYYLVRNYEEFYWVQNHLKESKIVADHNLYTYNDFANATLIENGAELTTIPLELNKSEIMNRYNNASEIIVYGYYPLMVTAGCVHKNTKGCDHKKTVTFIKDRYNIEFPIHNHCDECYNVIYNSLPTLLIGKIEELEKAGVPRFRFQFTLESAKETEAILQLFNEQIEEGKFNLSNHDKDFTNGHYKRGVE